MWPTRRATLIAAVISGLGVLGLMLWQTLLGLQWSGAVDYGARPPAEVFADVTGKPVSIGVTDLRTSGRSFMLGIKHWVWMSFSADDRAFKTLVGDQEPLYGDRAAELIRQNWSVSNRYDERDRRAVRWDEVDRIKRPEAYVAAGGKPNSSFVWCGVLIIDRERHRGYIHVGGD